jgi:hypothetical protein
VELRQTEKNSKQKKSKKKTKKIIKKKFCSQKNFSECLLDKLGSGEHEEKFLEVERGRERSKT